MRTKGALLLLLCGLMTSAQVQTPGDYHDVEIDFGACAPVRRTVSFAFGSTTFEVEGMAAGRCVMKYGTEIENPHWDGFLDRTCKVPPLVGRLGFKVGDAGVDFARLEPYCGATPRPKSKPRRAKRRAARPRRAERPTTAQ